MLIDPYRFGATGGLTELTWFFAENMNASRTVTGAPVTKRAEWEAYLTNIGRLPLTSQAELAQSFTTTMSPRATQVTFTSVNSADWYVILDNGAFGRFDTTTNDLTGKYLEGSLECDFTFNEPIRAFGAYMTDVGDFRSRIRMELYTNAADVTPAVIYDPGHTQGLIEYGGSYVGNIDHTGSLMFLGFIDPTATYRRVRFEVFQYNTDPNYWDYFGLDDLAIGDYP